MEKAPRPQGSESGSEAFGDICSAVSAWSAAPFFPSAADAARHSRRNSCAWFPSTVPSLFKHQISRELTTMKLYVGNLPFSVTEAELRETFSRFGDVAKVDLVSDRFTGESRGFGFVEMDSNSQADAAIKSHRQNPTRRVETMACIVASSWC